MPGLLIRSRDISGNRFPKGADVIGTGTNAPATPVSRPPEIEPGTANREFLLSWSVSVPGASTAQLFTLDGGGNITNGAAFQLPDNSRARISGVIIEGDTILGAPVLVFSLRIDKAGNQRLPGWENVNLPGRGGIVNMGIEPFTIVPQGYFFGAFVQNLDAAPHYAAITIQGWQL